MAQTLAVVNPSDILPDAATTRERLQAIAAFQALVNGSLKEGHDYGVIPGSGNKPTLLKPGAEKIVKLLGLADTYDFLEELQDWDRPLFSYTVKCRLLIMGTETVVSEGIGECNSLEKKYRYRWVFPGDVPVGLDKELLKKRQGVSQRTRQPYTQYQIENDEIYDLINTLKKMSKKRALVDAALSAGRLSDLFTQDIEDLETAGDRHAAGNEQEEARPARQALRTSLESTGRPVPTPDSDPATEGQRRAVEDLSKKAGIDIEKAPIDPDLTFGEAKRLIQQLQQGGNTEAA